MPDDEIESRLRKLIVEHAETRWLALRLDDDVKDIKEVLRAVRGTQDEHSATLAGHSSILAEHSSILAEHSSILAEHSATLAEHSATLAEHSTILTEHTGRFDSVDAQLRSLTQLVGQVLDRLPDDRDDTSG